MVRQVIILLLCATSAIAMSVELQWDANKEADLAGYKVYYRNLSRRSSQFELVSTLHKQTTVKLANLSSNHKHVFAVTAYNTASQESSFSNKVYVGLPVANMKVKALRGSIR